MNLMSLRAERRLFQIVVLLGSLVPILAGGAGVVAGTRMIKGLLVDNADLQSHFRYLSGLLLGIGMAFVFCSRDLDRRAPLFNALALIVVTGGLSRLLGFALVGAPSAGHRFGLVMELIVVPALMVWLRRVRRRSALERAAAL